VPMEHICLTLDDILLSLRRHDSPNFVLSSAEIEASVSASKLRSFSDALS
jgi:hypothetical protein